MPEGAATCRDLKPSRQAFQPIFAGFIGIFTPFYALPINGFVNRRSSVRIRQLAPSFTGVRKVYGRVVGEPPKRGTPNASWFPY